MKWPNKTNDELIILSIRQDLADAIADLHDALEAEDEKAVRELTEEVAMWQKMLDERNL